MLVNLTFLVNPLWGGLNNSCRTGLRCNSLEWNDHSASLRLALRSKNCSLYLVQLPDLGLSVIWNWNRIITGSSRLEIMRFSSVLALKGL